MKFLIVEDDFAARKLLQILLADFGTCFIAVDGREAITAFTQALEENDPYDLICLDIMMPEMDGHETLRRMRTLEEERGIRGLDGVKVIMTTALRDSKNILGAFREGCEAYIVKPVARQKLIHEMTKLGILAACPEEAS